MSRIKMLLLWQKGSSGTGDINGLVAVKNLAVSAALASFGLL